MSVYKEFDFIYRQKFHPKKEKMITSQLQVMPTQEKKSKMLKQLMM